MEDSPFYVQPILGFKVLEYFGPGDERVVSPYRNSYQWWPNRSSEVADCRPADTKEPSTEHPSPSEACDQCGFYAFYEWGEASRIQQLFHTVQGINFEFIALVAGWGDVVLHKEGFRSSRMEVVGVHNGHYPLKDRLRKYARKIGAPFLPRHELEALAREVGMVFTPEDVERL